jgi:hypothetical protein
MALARKELISMSDVVEQQDVQQEVQEQRPRLSLESRLGAVLADAHASSSELRELIEAAEAEANAAESGAKRLHAEALTLGCTDAGALEQQAIAADLMVARLDAALPRLDDLLRKEAADDYARKWRARRDRALVARETMATRLAHYREIAAQLVNIFEEVQYLDAHIIEPVNQSRPASEPPITTCELYVRKLESFSRSIPSILEKVQLPDWTESERLMWPKKAQSIGLLVAGAMAVISRGAAHKDKYVGCAAVAAKVI